MRYPLRAQLDSLNFLKNLLLSWHSNKFANVAVPMETKHPDDFQMFSFPKTCPRTQVIYRVSLYFTYPNANSQCIVTS